LAIILFTLLLTPTKKLIFVKTLFMEFKTKTKKAIKEVKPAKKTPKKKVVLGAGKGLVTWSEDAFEPMELVPSKKGWLL